jgi:hypothetical protein
MSLESFAFQKLKERHPSIARCGLRKLLRQLDRDLEPAEEISTINPGFVPDATLWDAELSTLRLFEIEDTSKLSKHKLHNIQGFGHLLLDLAGICTELWVTDRYGMNETKIWDVRDDVPSFRASPDDCLPKDLSP